MRILDQFKINFTVNTDREENTTKETVLDFSQGTVKVLWVQFTWVQLRLMQFHWIIWFLSV